MPRVSSRFSSAEWTEEMRRVFVAHAVNVWLCSLEEETFRSLDRNFLDWLGLRKAIPSFSRTFSVRPAYWASHVMPKTWYDPQGPPEMVVTSCISACARVTKFFLCQACVGAGKCQAYFRDLFITPAHSTLCMPQLGQSEKVTRGHVTKWPLNSPIPFSLSPHFPSLAWCKAYFTVGLYDKRTANMGIRKVCLYCKCVFYEYLKIALRRDSRDSYEYESSWRFKTKNLKIGTLFKINCKGIPGCPSQGARAECKVSNLFWWQAKSH